MPTVATRMGRHRRVRFHCGRRIPLAEITCKFMPGSVHRGSIESILHDKMFLGETMRETLGVSNCIISQADQYGTISREAFIVPDPEAE